jgi:hypothetical protein
VNLGVRLQQLNIADASGGNTLASGIAAEISTPRTPPDGATQSAASIVAASAALRSPIPRRVGQPLTRPLGLLGHVV